MCCGDTPASWHTHHAPYQNEWKSLQTTRPELSFGHAVALPAAADVIPVDLPRPDDKPPAKDKPVKVFILSGQSNALGFGRIEGATPLYSRVFLSADPSVKPCKLPVDNAALLPLKIYRLRMQWREKVRHRGSQGRYHGGIPR